MKEISIVIGAIFGLIIIGFLLDITGLYEFKFIAPKYEDARRQVFENTKSYRDGTQRDFDNLYLSYEAAKTPEEKSAILGVIRHRAEGTPQDLVPADIVQLLK